MGSTLEETEQLLAEHNSFKEKARETREKVNYTLQMKLEVKVNIKVSVLVKSLARLTVQAHEC